WICRMPPRAPRSQPPANPGLPWRSRGGRHRAGATARLPRARHRAPASPRAAPKQRAPPRAMRSGRPAGASAPCLLGHTWARLCGPNSGRTRRSSGTPGSLREVAYRARQSRRAPDTRPRRRGGRRRGAKEREMRGGGVLGAPAGASGLRDVRALVDLDSMAASRPDDSLTRLLLGRLALKFSLVPASHGVADVGLVVDRQVLTALPVDVCELARA